MTIERKAEMIRDAAAGIAAALELAQRGLPEHTREGVDAAELAARLDLLWVAVRPLAQRIELDAMGIRVEAAGGRA